MRNRIYLASSLLALLSAFALGGCSLQGEIGPIGPKGDTGPAGPKGDNGKDGVSVVSVSKIGTEGNNDIYEIQFSDGTSSTFKVSNGKDGSSVSVKDVYLKSSEDGIDTYEILFSDGFKTTFTVTNGKNLTILSIEKVSTNGLFDTYRINYSDGKYVEFVVSNGATPYIGENGNWWIDGTDTGVVADYSKEDNRQLSLNNKISSLGLTYSVKTIYGKTGFVVSFDASSIKDVALNNYKEYSFDLSRDEYSRSVDYILQNMDVVIPNYVGSTPVIGIESKAFCDVSIRSISISRNTIYIGDGAFAGTTKLESFDFNNSNITYIPGFCFSGSGITSITLPSSVSTLYDYAFYGCKLINFDLTHIKYFGSCCLNGLMDDYVWISNEVESVEEDSFDNTFVYIEKGVDSSKWFSSNNLTYFGGIIDNCYKNEELIYAYNDEGVTAYRWLKKEKAIEVPSKIDGKDVTIIGSGFANRLKKYNEVKTAANSIKEINQIKLPNTVKKIELGAINVTGALVYIPSSVAEIDQKIGYCCELPKPFLAFEGNDLPSFNGFGSSILTPDEWIDGYGRDARLAKGLDFNNISYSESDSIFYYENNISSSILACMDFDAFQVETPKVFNNKVVNLINSGAYAGLPNLKEVIISKNINKISKNAFTDLSLIHVFVLSTSLSINKYGFDNCSKYYFVSVSSTPDDWDTNWNGSSSSNVFYGFEGTSFGEEHGFYYYTIENKATLYSYNSILKDIVLPSFIGEFDVTSIETGFDSNQKISRNFYIPSSIIFAHKFSFNNGNNYFYFEAGKTPDGFSSFWYGNSYSSRQFYYNYVLPVVDYESNLIYLEVEEEIKLLHYIGKEKTIFIPRTINNKNVTTINDGFLESSSGRDVYIPNNITTIKTNAFVGTSAEVWNFYFESPKGSSGYSNSISPYSSKTFYNQQLDY